MKTKALPLLALLIACSTTTPKVDIETLKAEIMQAEKNFNDMAAENGIAAAFAAFAAEDGVIKRGPNLVKGKAAIGEWYEANGDPEAKLTWKPDFIDVSSSGDLAYTYGGYEYSAPDSTGTMITSTGYFHSVWKRQADGNWKFVWD